MAPSNMVLLRWTVMLVLMTAAWVLFYTGHMEYRASSPFSRHGHHSGGQQSKPHKHHGPPSIMGQSPEEFRYESNDAWRDDTVKYSVKTRYPKGSENIFFMIKTGGSELWNKLPLHLYTSMPRMKNFAIYSDAPGSIGGHEVIDILQNVTAKRRLESDEFKMYRLQREIHDRHGVYDYGQNDLKQGWALDKYKNVPMLYDAYLKCPTCDWFVMMDADSYIMVDNLAQWLGNKDPKQPLYHGSLAGMGINFAHGGSGILVSRAAVEKAFSSKPVNELLEQYEQSASGSCCGDAVLAIMLKDQAGVLASTGEGGFTSVFQGNPYWDVRVTEELWCKPVISFHHANQHDIQITWEWEQTKLRSKHLDHKKNGITFGDVYRDFYLPYIDEERPHWDNMAREEVISNSHETSDAWKSKDHCKQHCHSDERCLCWRYLPEVQLCAIERGVRLGRAAHKHLDVKADQNSEFEKRNGVVSGWMIDRIRHIRNKVECDKAHDDDRELGGVDRREGWWLRSHPEARDGLTQFD